jgi:hypothetical protein
VALRREQLREGGVSTTATYYIKTAADDVLTAMTKLDVVGKELQGDVATEFEVFRLIDHPHPPPPIPLRIQ